MELRDIPEQIAISKHGKWNSSNSIKIGVYLFQAPTFFILLALLAGTAKNAIGKFKPVPGYKFGIVAACLLFSIPLGWVFNQLAKFTSTLTSRLGYTVWAVLGGIVWATALSISFQIVSVTYLIITKPRIFLHISWLDIA